MTAARDALARAAQTAPDAVSSSYGPRLALAKELVARGEHEAVASYLRKRLESWKPSHYPAQQWVAALEAGQTPAWDGYRDHI